jgi:hypothetical protein
MEREKMAELERLGNHCCVAISLTNSLGNQLFNIAAAFVYAYRLQIECKLLVDSEYRAMHFERTCASYVNTMYFAISKWMEDENALQNEEIHVVRELKPQYVDYTPRIVHTFKLTSDYNQSRRASPTHASSSAVAPSPATATLATSSSASSKKKPPSPSPSLHSRKHRGFFRQGTSPNPPSNPDTTPTPTATTTGTLSPPNDRDRDRDAPDNHADNHAENRDAELTSSSLVNANGHGHAHPVNICCLIGTFQNYRYVEPYRKEFFQFLQLNVLKMKALQKWDTVKMLMNEDVPSLSRVVGMQFRKTERMRAYGSIYKHLNAKYYLKALQSLQSRIVEDILDAYEHTHFQHRLKTMPTSLTHLWDNLTDPEPSAFKTNLTVTQYVLCFCDEGERETVAAILDELPSHSPQEWGTEEDNEIMGFRHETETVSLRVVYRFLMVPNEPALADWEHMMLLAQCKYTVISNSLFGWWSGYFNETDDGAVVYPLNWQNKTNPLQNCVKELCSSEWVRWKGV